MAATPPGASDERGPSISDCSSLEDPRSGRTAYTAATPGVDERESNHTQDMAASHWSAAIGSYQHAPISRSGGAVPDVGAMHSQDVEHCVHAPATDGAYGVQAGEEDVKGVVLQSIVSHSVLSTGASSPTGSLPAVPYTGSSTPGSSPATPHTDGPSRHASADALRVQLFTVMQMPMQVPGGSPSGGGERGIGEGGPHREASLGWALPGEHPLAAQRVEVCFDWKLGI